MESGRGETRMPSYWGQRGRGEMHICTLTSGLCCVLFSNSQGDWLMNYKWINEFFLRLPHSPCWQTDTTSLLMPCGLGGRNEGHLSHMVCGIPSMGRRWRVRRLLTASRPQGPCRQRTTFNPWRKCQASSYLGIHITWYPTHVELHLKIDAGKKY